MSKTAFMFPGQGSQCVGMGADFYEACPKARAVYDMASELIGIDMKRLCFEENEHLDQTEFTQIALLTTGMAMEQSIRACGLTPDVTAGLSLGEYNAIVSAGGMEMADAMKVVRRRGILMERPVPFPDDGSCVPGADRSARGRRLYGVEDSVCDECNRPVCA